MKIIVFDIDETLGYFLQLGILHESIEAYNKQNLTQQKFNELVDLYPQYLRPNILNILKYLKEELNKKKIDRVMIFTNNQGGGRWMMLLINYFNYKVNYRLFSQIVGPFTINNRRYELCRTSHDKTFNDLLNCLKIKNSSNLKICFIDDRNASTNVTSSGILY